MYVPSKVMTNADFEKIVDTSDEWIQSRSGIKERRIAAKDEFTSDMGAAAAKAALADAGITSRDIDFILVATLTPDHAFPATACLIQQAIGAGTAPAIDVQAACSGYIYCLGLAKALIESGAYKNILIVASEKLSSIVDYEDRSTCVLFGDGAAACVVGCKGAGLKIRAVSLGADGAQSQLLILPAGGSRRPASQETVANKEHFLKMSGKETFKHAVRRMEEACKSCLEMTGLKESDISFLIPHQANLRIIAAIAKRFPHLSKDQVISDIIVRFGNTSASSIGLALDELKKRGGINDGDNILLTAFGAGLTWGGAILTEDYTDV